MTDASAQRDDSSSDSLAELGLAIWTASTGVSEFPAGSPHLAGSYRGYAEHLTTSGILDQRVDLGPDEFLETLALRLYSAVTGNQTYMLSAEHQPRFQVEHVIAMYRQLASQLISSGALDRQPV